MIKAELHSPEPSLRAPAAERRGTLQHSEHFVDLILEQAGFPGDRQFQAFSAIAEKMIAELQQDTIPTVNEKIDGSPAVVLGFDAEGKAFVAYKKRYEHSEQVLFTNSYRVDQFYEGNLALRRTYRGCVKYLLPQLEKLREEFGDFTFQADVLFAPRNGNKLKAAQTLYIQPQLIKYVVNRDHPLYEALDQAKVGIVVHTIGRRVVNPETGRVESEAHYDPLLVRRFAELLNGKDACVLHPYRDRVPVPEPLSAETATQIREFVKDIELNLKVLSDEFRREWLTKHLPHFRTFFNSALRGAKKGGIYRIAARGDEFDPQPIIHKFKLWLPARLVRRDKVDPLTLELKSQPPVQQQQYLDQVSDLFQKSGAELQATFRAYYLSLRVQSLLMPHLKHAMESKLGGTLAEGVMHEHEDLCVKVVDRLGFTMQNFNNTRWRRRADTLPAAPNIHSPKHIAELERLPAPLDIWRPGEAFTRVKLQPPHIGHHEMFKVAMDRLDGLPLHIIASSKAPHMDAKRWDELGAAKSKAHLVERDYVHFMQAGLREKLMRHVVPKGASVSLLPVATLREYLKRAVRNEEQGKIKLLMGQKDYEAGSFNDLLEGFPDHCEALVVEPQQAGISATNVREAIRLYAETQSPEVFEFLMHAFSYISGEKMRPKIIQEVIGEWRALDMKAQALLEIQSKRKKH